MKSSVHAHTAQFSSVSFEEKWSDKEYVFLCEGAAINFSTVSH